MAEPGLPEPSLSPEERAAFEKGVAEFNAGLFFECHDILEDVWSGVRGPSRDFFQGLIQVAVGFYHLGNDNRSGAVRLLARARKRLEAYPDVYGGIAVGELRVAVAEWERALDAGTERPASLPALPRLRLVDPSESGPPPRVRKPGPP